MEFELVVTATSEQVKAKAEHFAKLYKLNSMQEQVSGSTADFQLLFEDEGVSLVDKRYKQRVEIKANFNSGANAHRMKFGGGKSQAIAKAVGITRQNKPSVLDVTAGLGGDAFVLASLGCEVLMLERSLIAFTLLEDGLERARKFCLEPVEEEVQDLAATLARLTLQRADAIEFLNFLRPNTFNVIYLDPMFPPRKKSAQVKKEMLAFHDLIGRDEDAGELLVQAMEKAENRVVVKRSAIAPYLGNVAPTYQLKGKSSRFDIYTKKKFDI